MGNSHYPARLVRIPDRFHCCPSNYMTGLGQPSINLVNDILGVELVHFLTKVIGPTEEMKKITSN